LYLVCGPAWSQTASLSLTSASGLPGSVVSVDVTLTGGSASAAVQWDLSYPTGELGFFGSEAGPSATASGKEVVCSEGNGRATCIVYGLNEDSLSDGVLATVFLLISPTTTETSVSLTLSGVVASSPGGVGVPIVGVGSDVTIEPNNGEPCSLDLTLSYAPNTLTAEFMVGASEPTVFTAVLFYLDTSQYLWSFQIPVIWPPEPATVPLPMSEIGYVGLIGALSTPGGPPLCWDWAILDTGGVGASVEDLRRSLETHGLSGSLSVP